MLIYEKKVEGERHLFGTLESVPADTDEQLTYEGTASLDRKYFDDGHGGIIDEDREALRVRIGEVYVIPKDYDAEDAELSYDANGGTGTMDSTEGEVAHKVKVAECTFEKEGSDFTEWNTKADGTGDSYDAGDDYILTGDNDTLYAQWS